VNELTYESRGARATRRSGMTAGQRFTRIGTIAAKTAGDPARAPRIPE
jgi:hypothetical protein